MYLLSRIRSLSLLIWKQINMVKFSNLLSVGAFPGGSLGFCILQKYITVQLAGDLQQCKKIDVNFFSLFYWGGFIPGATAFYT